MNYRLSWFLRRHCGESHTAEELARAADVASDDLPAEFAALVAARFRFDDHPGAGLRLIEAPPAYDRDEIAFARAEAGGRLGRTVYVYRRTASTNDVALRLAAAGSGTEGAVVLAEEQTAGRGRRGARWFGSPHASLMVSVIARAPAGSQSSGAVTLASGVAVAEAIDSVARLRTGIKWPNDVEIGRRKVAGVLVERGGGAGRGGAYVIGIGINVGQAPTDIPPELRPRATSLQMAAGHPVDRILLLEALLGRLEARLDALDSGNEGELLDAYESRSDMVGRHVTLRRGGERFEGTVASVSPQFALVVRLDSGELASFDAQSVRLDPSTA